MTNQRHTTLYVGVTSELKWRAIEHQDKKYPRSFTSRYNINKLVYFEVFDDIESAIFREKQIKSWSRDKKVRLIESSNPEWGDLFEEEVKDW